MSDGGISRKELARQLKAERAKYKATNKTDHRIEAYKLLAELGRSTKQLKRLADQQQTKLF